MSSLPAAFRQYLLNHSGPQFTAKETELSSPLQFVLSLAAEREKILLRTNHDAVTEAVTGEA